MKKDKTFIEKFHAINKELKAFEGEFKTEYSSTELELIKTYEKLQTKYRKNYDKLKTELEADIEKEIEEIRIYRNEEAEALHDQLMFRFEERKGDILKKLKNELL